MRKKILSFLKKNLNKNQVDLFRVSSRRITRFFGACAYPYAKVIHTPLMVWRNKQRPYRQLEIGPGPERIDGFETMNVVWGRNVDYIGDASKRLPFSPESFDVIYASHILEHIPWYKIPQTISEWVRVLKPGGAIEIWLPNGLLIAQTFVDAELGKSNSIDNDGWYKFNEKRDPCVWANGRIFSYGDGTGRKNDPNWHMALCSPRYLKDVLMDAGLQSVVELKQAEVRGFDHGWINLGFRALKPL